MTFDAWCNSKQIKGSWKEALFRQLFIEYGPERIDSLGQDTWAVEWKKLLRRIVSSLLPAGVGEGG